MPWRVLVAGLGRIGFGFDSELAEQYVYSHARAFAQHPAFDLVGGVDQSSEARDAFTRHYSVGAWASLSDVPDSVAPSVLVVAVPTERHLETVEVGLQRWPLAILLCEKPLASSLDDAARLVTLCRNAGVPLMVNYIRRADPAVARVASMIAGGVIASPMKGVLWYSKGLLHNGSHLLDLAGHWLGAWQSARVLRTVGDDPDFEVEFERGWLVGLAAREDDYSHYTIELISPSGRLRYDLNGTLTTWQSVMPHPKLAGYRVLATTPEPVPGDMTRYQWHVADQLANALAGRPHPLATGADALLLHRHLHTLMEIS